MEIFIHLDSALSTPAAFGLIDDEKKYSGLLMEGRKARTCLRMCCTAQAGPLCHSEEVKGQTEVHYGLSPQTAETPSTNFMTQKHQIKDYYHLGTCRL